MKVHNRVELKLENFEKCHVVSDIDCPLGQLYDYACAFKAFIMQKMQDGEAQKPAEVKVEQPVVEEPAQV